MWFAFSATLTNLLHISTQRSITLISAILTAKNMTDKRMISAHTSVLLYNDFYPFSVVKIVPEKLKWIKKSPAKKIFPPLLLQYFSKLVVFIAIHNDKRKTPNAGENIKFRVKLPWQKTYKMLIWKIFRCNCFHITY